MNQENSAANRLKILFRGEVSAVIADVHGNAAALAAVLEDIQSRGIKDIYCLGDVIGYGAQPGECLRLVGENCRAAVQGNHESAVLNQSEQDRMRPDALQTILWTKEVLTPEEKGQISAWPLVYAGLDARLVHASPHHSEQFNYLFNLSQMEMAFGAFSEGLCFFGHTHFPMSAELLPQGEIRIFHPRTVTLEPSKRYLINPGSVGQPRDGDPRAKWIQVFHDPLGIAFQSTVYDIVLTQKTIIQAGLPRALAIRLETGR